jgi:hypothetical protein
MKGQTIIILVFVIGLTLAIAMGMLAFVIVWKDYHPWL